MLKSQRDSQYLYKELRANHTLVVGGGMIMKDRVKIVGLLATAAIISYPASVASAQEAEMETQAKSAGGLEEIIVTARKRDENIQDVPASVSALSAGELDRRFDSDVRDFANSSPNIVIDDTQQGPGGVAAVYIRGVGVADVEKSVDQRGLGYQ